jgi:predicted GNAT family N-acyltransferase
MKFKQLQTMIKNHLLESSSDEELNKSLKEIRNKWKEEGIESFMYAKNGDITLSEIVIPKEHRGKGLGTNKMKELLSFAKENNQRVLLTPSTDFGATSKKRLEKFYSNLGFKKNAGRNRDFTTRETMIWEPNNIK